MSIVLEGVRKSFGERVILDDVSVRVEEGETVAVIGASGEPWSSTSNLTPPSNAAPPLNVVR